ncbi:hypothetical protein [Sphingomonas sp. TREG-RG-20F-R18-01]|uniref:hypothetical protein n=1 Tax=Sphingomonas sp. TREG-RG-20F-R18-01 TaxID=2914982 RepID=UPI001F58F97A|nr:hypothetical protein [Sphingomonas sp. TREG-RG-20F-R18-01]
MTPAERRRKLLAVTRFERAAADHAFKGAAHSDDWDAIERSFLQAKANLLRAMGFEVEKMR